MRVSDLIITGFPVAEPGMAAAEALEMLEAHGISHIPVYEAGVFHGSLSKATLESYPEAEISDVLGLALRFSVSPENFILDVLPVFPQFDTNVLPVIGLDLEFQGVIFLDDVVEELAKYPAFGTPGHYMIISSVPGQYSISQISQIIERENGRLAGIWLSKLTETEVEITVKLNAEVSSGITDTLQRYGYQVIMKTRRDLRDDVLKDRFEFVQKYLEL